MHPSLPSDRAPFLDLDHYQRVIWTRKLRNWVIILVFFLSAVPGYGWKFASTSDSHVASGGPNTAVLTNLVNRINVRNVDFVLFEGDALNGSSNDATFRGQFDNWLRDVDFPATSQPHKTGLCGAVEKRSLAPCGRRICLVTLKMTVTRP